MNVELLTEHHLGFLSLKDGCTCTSESTLVKIPHCLKSHVTAQIYLKFCEKFWFNILSINIFETMLRRILLMCLTFSCQ